MKPIVAVLDKPLPAIQAALDARYRCHAIAEDPAAIAGEAAEARALVTSGGKGASAAMIAAFPKLEIIANNSVGNDQIDLDAARARGIRVTNTPDVLNDDVADLAIALMLAVFRGLCTGDRYVRAGSWAAGAPLPLARRMSGARLGILGLGRIGKAIARRAEPIVGSIAYTGRKAQPVPYAFVESAVALAAQADILVVAVPASPDTQGIVDRAVISALGETGVLVNVARGSVVDEDALVTALVEGKLGGAGLDVFRDEPAVPQALLALENVVLQPHRGSATTETRLAMGQLVLDNLDAHFAGRPLLTPVA